MAGIGTFTRTFLILFSATLPISVAKAQTQPVSAQGATALGEVVIEREGNEDPLGPVRGVVANRSATATKTNTPILETPQAIGVVGAEQMRLQQPTTVTEATRYSAGVRSETFGADARNDWFLIRGFPQQTTGYFLDGLQLYSTSFATWKLDPWSLERIEILRGPASTLYGGGDPGGIINAISRRPPSTFGGRAETGIDSFGNAYGALDVGGPVDASGKWLYRLSMIGRLGGTQTDYTENDRFHIAPALTWQPSPDTSLTILASYTRDLTRGQNFLPYVGTVVSAPWGRIPTSLFTGNPGYDHFRREQAMLGYALSHRVNDTLTIRQNGRMAYLSVDYQTVYGGGYATTAAAADLLRYNFVTSPTAYQFNLDTQAEWRFSTGALSHTLLTGIDLKRYQINDDQGFAFGTNLNLLNPVYTPVTPVTSRYILGTVVQSQAGFYVQDQIRLGGFNLVLGGRYDSVSTSLTNRLNPAADTSDTTGRFTGRAALMYTTAFGLAPYVSYATSFNPQVGTNGLTGQLLQPETGRGLEAGVKFRPTGWNVTFGAAVFDIRRENVSTTIYTPAFATSQIGAIRSRGVELEANADLGSGWKVIAAYTHADPRVVSDLDTTLIGHTPAGIPRQFASLWAHYTVQDGALAGLGLSAGVRYVGESFADGANTLPVPAYAVVDAGLKYEYRNWTMRMTVTNLFDKTYVASCSSASACFYGDRRRATVSIGYRW
ncbi:TonB-dependent siderophore receptor [Phreatobacter cathodiphilus]|uniref:TonB-dependent siderophore receptor n=1 Tax=Phreatobacter cathodiphilus TaxID=1868589 RepID=A0A2S0N7S4_9HYPH|nr:TonB-dependent siderophore receptor [Phreatobacter cathodiphilus]